MILRLFLKISKSVFGYLGDNDHLTINHPEVKSNKIKMQFLRIFQIKNIFFFFPPN